MTTAADFIRANSDAILRLWFDAASQVASARGLARPEFTNLMPKFLAALAEADADLGTFSGERRRYFESHLASRIRQGFSAEEVVAELALVRRAAERILPELASRDVPPEKELDRLWKELQQAAATVNDLFARHMAEDEQVEKHYLRRLRALAAAALREGAPPLRERLDEVLALVMQAMAADSTTLMLYDAGAKELTSVASVGVARQEDYVASLEISSFVGQVAASEEPLRLENVPTTRLVIPEALRQSGIRSLLGLRLPERETLTGVIYVGLREQRPFSGRDAARLEVLGEQLTLHLDNAALIQKLEDHIRALRDERELRERFVSVLAHDLRGPLSSAKMALEMLIEPRFAPSDARGGTRVDLLQRIDRSLTRTDHMVRDLLDANRIHAGEAIPLTLAPCDLVAIARNARAELASVHGDRFVVEGDPEVRGTWDEDEVFRCLWNLGVNAVKYGAPDARITVGARAAKEHAEISVHNRGAPIPEEDQTALFRPFVRSLTAKASSAKGWGLGLTVVRGVAEAHGGRVRVESSAEAGTTFTLELPYVSPTPA